MNEKWKDIYFLYSKPFVYSYGYIYSGSEMVADFRGGLDGKSLRPRGYGRMKYLPNGNDLHDTHEAFLISLTREWAGDSTKCIEILNRTWSSSDSFANAYFAHMS